MAEYATDSTELNIIENSLDTFRDAGDILKNNQLRAQKATAVGQKILADLEANGGVMTPELDTRMLNFLANCNKAKKEMNEARSVFTQTLTIIAKSFTSEENRLDVNNKETEAYRIQQVRNAYAEQLHREEQRRQLEIQKEQEKAQEIIAMKAECERRLIKYFGEYLAAEKQRINTVFNAITLETYEAKSKGLNDMTPAYPYDHFSKFAHSLYGKLLTQEELSNIALNVCAGRFDGFAADYKVQVMELRDFLIERLPSKKMELENIRAHEEEVRKEQEEQERIRKERETADAEQKKILDQQRKESEERQRRQEEEARQIEADRLQREQEEQARIQQEEEARQREQQTAVNMSQEFESTMSLFEQEVAISEVEVKAPQVRQGYEIEVLGAAGWMQIFQLWFNEEGVKLTNDKIAAKKIESLKTFCEKHAHATGNKIQSNFLTYRETFKAVNRK